MTRGRKKNLSIPASRALTQQRDYRARKASYISDLEERCRQAEVENENLRKELESAKAGEQARPATFSLETAQATSELMQHLSAASVSLARFQQLALADSQHLSPPPLPNPWSLRPASFPPPGASSPFSSPSASFYPHYHHRIESPSEQTDLPNIDVHQSPSPSPSLGEECCGGIFDCRQLIEEEEPEGESDSRSIPLVRTSGMRSTSDGTPASPSL